MVQIMAWRRPGDKPLSEPMMGNSLTHICVTRPQWVNKLSYRGICYAIFLTKTKNFWWYELSPFGFITCNIISLCWLQRRSDNIIWWNNSGSSYLMLWNDSHTLIWRVILWYNEIIPGMLISKWLLHTKQYGLIHSECIHSLRHFLHKKGESLENSKYIQMGSPHVIQYLSFGYKKGSYNLMWWKNSGVYLTLKNDSHTPHNTVSSMVNVCIRYAIFWTKRGILLQFEKSPVGFIICNTIYLCWLQKGS